MSRPDGDLQDQLEFLLREGARYEFAPDLGCDILDRIDAYLARYIIYPRVEARHAHVLWIAHTWMMDCWSVTPRLALISPEPSSGKTRVLEITKCLVPHADLAVRLTPAYVYHAIDEQMSTDGGRPTLLYDELDTVFGPEAKATCESEGMRRIINGGFERGGTINVHMGSKRGNVRFPVFAAMVMAGVLGVYDLPPTIRTRCVIVQMQRRAPDEKIERWNRRTGPLEFEPLRDLLQFWIEFVHEKAGEHIPELPESLADRDGDAWEPLLTVADLAGGHWPQTARVAAVALVADVGSKATVSRGMLLLGDIKTVFEGCGQDRLPTKELLHQLQSLEESSWKALNDKTLGLRLAPYGVAPGKWRDGERTVRGYQRESFAIPWRRYPVSAEPATSATNATDGGGQ